MKEDMLHNDTEDIRQENTEAPASGNGAENDVIDLTEDEWHDAGSDRYVPELIPVIPDSLIPVLKIALPIAGAALVILILLIAGLSGKKTDKKDMKESYVSTAPRQEMVTEPEEAKPAGSAADQVDDAESETPVESGNAKEANEIDRNKDNKK